MDSKQYLEDYISKTMKTDLTVAIKTLLEELNKLERVAIETAFDKDNKDTEFLCRRLLAMGLIKLEDGVYKRNKLPYEENGFTIDGVVYDREKIFLIEDDKLDEYTKQLEKEKEKLQESYNERVQEIIDLEEKVEQQRQQIEEMLEENIRRAEDEIEAAMWEG